MSAANPRNVNGLGAHFVRPQAPIVGTTESRLGLVKTTIATRAVWMQNRLGDVESFAEIHGHSEVPARGYS